MREIRTRLVNFRVTDEEFERLKAAADRQGARCLSDFARASMLSQSKSRPDSEPMEDRMDLFDRRLAVLERSMSRLVEALAGSKIQSVGSDN